MGPRVNTRRQFLTRAGLVMGGVGVAGCLDSGSPQGNETEEESTETGAEDEESPSGETEDEETDDGEDEESAEDGANEEETTDEEEPSPESEENESGVNDADNGNTSGQNAETADNPQDLSFQSDDGVNLEGTLYGSSDCGAVLTPQINQERGSWESQATQLADQGYVAFAIDVDEDDRPASILGAVDILQKEQNIDRLVLVGASIGGEASVVANARSDSEAVQGVVALSPGGGTDYAGDLTGHKLFVASEDDDSRFVETTETLYENSSEPKEMRIFSGSAHGQGLFETEHGDDLFEEIEALLGTVCD